MTDHETAVINQFAEDRAEVVGASRFFNNERVSQEALIRAPRTACGACASKCEGSKCEGSKCEGKKGEGRHVLAIQDTTEVNYADHDGKLKTSDPELGPVGNDQDVGFFFHPTLAIDAESSLPIGFAETDLWNRRWDKQDKHQRNYAHNYAQQPIEEKESYRWIQSSRQAKKTLRDADRVTIIADREGDIYEELVEVPDEQADVLIRSRSDRRLASSSEASSSETEASTLYEHLKKRPSEGSYELEVTGNNGRRPRTARLEVRFGPVEVAKPKSNCHADTLPASVKLWALEAREVEAREVPETVPAGEEPICWRLLTSRSIETFEQAREAIRDYGKRPKIEQVFRLLKSEGLRLEKSRLEKSQLESGAALKKLCLLAAQVALPIREKVRKRPSSVWCEPCSVMSETAL